MDILGDTHTVCPSPPKEFIVIETIVTKDRTIHFPGSCDGASSKVVSLGYVGWVKHVSVSHMIPRETVNIRSDEIGRV